MHMSVTANTLLAYVIPLDVNKFDVDEATDKYDLAYKSGDFGILYDGMSGDYCFACYVVSATEAEVDNDFIKESNAELSSCKVPYKIGERLRRLSWDLTGEASTPRLQLICHYT